MRLVDIFYPLQLPSLFCFGVWLFPTTRIVSIQGLEVLRADPEHLHTLWDMNFKNIESWNLVTLSVSRSYEETRYSIFGVLHLFRRW